jgi:prepilin-type N-terminal cleavage/methylation domain-containing protein
VSSAKGFTLIELLIVVVIIGILATIAIPKFQGVKEKAYIASMQSDLRTLVTVQEAYFSDNVTYAATTTNLNYLASAGNTVTIIGSSGTGWSATAKTNLSTKVCGIYVGTAAPPTGATVEGSPGCQ